MKKLLLVDCPIIIWGMTHLLKDGSTGIEVSGAKTFEEMGALMETDSFDIVMIGLPIKPGRYTALLLEMLQKGREIAVMVFTHGEMPFPEWGMYRAGLRGILYKDAGTEEILAAVEQVVSGQIYVSQATFRKLMMQGTKPSNSFGDLTVRETEVAHMLMEGKRNSQIGEALMLMPSTVSTFKTRIFNKLHVTTIIEMEKIFNS
jgi:two-component system invasion response regulator UvrY